MGMITTNATVSSQKFTLIHSGEAREKSEGVQDIGKACGVHCFGPMWCKHN
jgi:hypothetical protein